jgi:alginate O-acetyltransferase complex protein AlgI
MQPAVRLFLAALGGILVLKVAALAARPARASPSGLLAFFLGWPGVVPDRFRTRGHVIPIEPAPFLSAWARMFSGGTLILLLAAFATRIPGRLLGLAGIPPLLLTLHLGICDLLPWLLRWAGFDVPPLFDRPWASASLDEFWSRRWNLAFTDMNRRFFVRPFYRRFGKAGARFALFVLSGALHEVGLSFPAGGGWGFPMAYFVLHGALVAVEDRFRIRNRCWTWFWLLAPAPWLFHEPFRRTLIVPFYLWLHERIAAHPGAWYLSRALYAAALGHLLVLAASLQVPARLHWREDLAKLTRFNRKIFVVYSLYILLCIVSFAALTWRLHDSFLAGDPGARGLAGFIAVFWSARVVIDIVWYDAADWPAGNALVAGHALVSTLFCALATVYWFAAFAA